MLITIITINLNNLKGLKATIESVEAQDYENQYEWIFIDGGSTDGSTEIIKSLKGKNIKWVSEPDTGVYQAMNKGIRMSTGEYILFMNSGDKIYSNDVLSKAAINLASGADLYIGKAKMGDVIAELDFSDDKKVLRWLQFYSINHQSVFIRKSLFDKYGFYREDHKISSDWWHFYKCLITGNATFKMLPFIVADYDITGISSAEHARVMERETLMDELPRQHLLARFYMENIEYINIMRANKFTFLISRILLGILRKFLPNDKIAV